MKLSIVKSGLFLSSYFPLYIILCLKNIKYIFQENVLGCKLWLFLTVNTLLILFSIYVVLCVIKGGKSNSLLVEEIEKPNDDVINYIFTYIAPIISFNLNDSDSIVVNLGLFILVWYMYVRLDLLYINPLLLMFGFTSYKTKKGYLISNVNFYELKMYEGTMVSGYFLSNNIFVLKNDEEDT